MKYTDETLMPFGKHKGEKLANVPGEYLFWLYKGDLDRYPELKAYITENLEAIKTEIHNKK